MAKLFHGQYFWGPKLSVCLSLRLNPSSVIESSRHFLIFSLLKSVQNDVERLVNTAMREFEETNLKEKNNSLQVQTDGWTNGWGEFHTKECVSELKLNQFKCKFKLRSGKSNSTILLNTSVNCGSVISAVLPFRTRAISCSALHTPH